MIGRAGSLARALRMHLVSLFISGWIVAIAALSSCSQPEQSLSYCLYVANQGTESVSAFAIQSNGLLAPIGTFRPSSQPTEVSFDPDGSYLYLANYGGGTVSTFAIRGDGSLQPLNTYTVDFVSRGNVAKTGTIYLFLSPSVSTGARQMDYQGVVTDPSGRFHYAADYREGTISVFNVQSKGLPALVGIFAVGGHPEALAIATIRN